MGDSRYHLVTLRYWDTKSTKFRDAVLQGLGDPSFFTRSHTYFMTRAALKFMQRAVEKHMNGDRNALFVEGEARNAREILRDTVVEAKSRFLENISGKWGERTSVRVEIEPNGKIWVREDGRRDKQFSTGEYGTLGQVVWAAPKYDEKDDELPAEERKAKYAPMVGPLDDFSDEELSAAAAALAMIAKDAPTVTKSAVTMRSGGTVADIARLLAQMPDEWKSKRLVASLSGQSGWISARLHSQDFVHVMDDTPPQGES